MTVHGPGASGSRVASRTARQRFEELVTSVEGIYGLIIVAGMIVVSRNLTGSSADALISVVLTLLVFFAAHVYAVVVSRLAASGKSERDARPRVREAVGHGLRESAGLLFVGVIPVAVLALGVFGVVRSADAVWLALGVDVVLLGFLGWFLAASRSPRLVVRLWSGLATAAFGAVLIALKVLVHN